MYPVILIGSSVGWATIGGSLTASTSNTLIGSGSNLTGILVPYIALSIYPDTVTDITVDFSQNGGGTFWGVLVPFKAAAVAQPVNFIMPWPIQLPAGVSLAINTAGPAAYRAGYRVSYRIF